MILIYCLIAFFIYFEAGLCIYAGAKINEKDNDPLWEYILGAIICGLIWPYCLWYIYKLKDEDLE